MSSPIDEESKGCPSSVYHPPYQELEQPYHDDPGYSKKNNPAYPSSNKLPFPTIEHKSSNTFCCVVLCLMIALIFGAVLLSLLLWFLVGSNVPSFEIQKFAIPSFNFTDTKLKANWEARLNIKNPNHKLDISFDQTKSSLVYKNFVVDTSLVESFQVERTEEMDMDTYFFVPAPVDTYYSTTEAPWVKDMIEERRKGTMVFEVRIIATATFMAWEFWRRQTTLQVVCVELKVDFLAPTGGGTWNGDKKECMLYH